MNSITFEDMNGNVKNTYEDWNLLLKPREIPKPEPKTSYVDVPGGDGALDLSEVVAGEVKYSDYVIPFEFHVLDEELDWDSKVSLITNFIHGKKMIITLDSDPDYYYEGRCSIDKFTSSKRLGSIAINCLVKPYKLKKIKTSVSADLGNSTTEKKLSITNDRMRVVPKITCTNDVIVTFEDNTYSLNAGTHTVLDINFKEGLNEMKVQGTGLFIIEFQEGSL